MEGSHTVINGRGGAFCYAFIFDRDAFIPDGIPDQNSFFSIMRTLHR